MRANEERLRTIVNSVSDGILLVDGRSILHFANPAAAGLDDRAIDELVGKPIPFARGRALATIAREGKS